MTQEELIRALSQVVLDRVEDIEELIDERADAIEQVFEILKDYEEAANVGQIFGGHWARIENVFDRRVNEILAELDQASFEVHVQYRMEEKENEALESLKRQAEEDE